MSLYSRYAKEREGKDTLESDKGFCTYTFLEDGVYIETIYTLPEHRDSGEASRLADQVVVIAKEKGFSKLYGSVKPSANGSTVSLKVLLAYGFRLHQSGPDAIVLIKDI